MHEIDAPFKRQHANIRTRRSNDIAIAPASKVVMNLSRRIGGHRSGRRTHRHCERSDVAAIARTTPGGRHQREQISLDCCVAGPGSRPMSFRQ
jgi:hypothetical protein